MASNTKFFYKRLRKYSGFEEEEERLIERTTRLSWIKRFALKKKPKVRIPGLRRFFRKKKVLFTNARFSVEKILNWFMESRSHLGDIFAGNYFFLQVSPSSLKCSDKSFMGHHLHGLPSRHTHGRIA
ncbi:hypothetical protein IFM89_027713 [Coptis chinensis]|uniref:Uncharacterized protein n=1 Tax=Coptis chinensis TaxID=261450 RepID=A0A835LXD5_9MAGN|nr:hypothetical protein IFM89_027713 [Coptis chinensis]